MSNRKRVVDPWLGVDFGESHLSLREAISEHIVNRFQLTSRKWHNKYDMNSILPAQQILVAA